LIHFYLNKQKSKRLKEISIIAPFYHETSSTGNAFFPGELEINQSDIVNQIFS